MRVSSSGYYSWLNRGLSSRSIENQQLTKSIGQVFIQNRHVYGTRRIAKILARSNIDVSTLFRTVFNKEKSKLCPISIETIIL